MSSFSSTDTSSFTMSVFSLLTTTLKYLGYGLAGLVLTILAAYFYLYIWTELSCSFKNVPGPAPDHWLIGNLSYIVKRTHPYYAYEKWLSAYGPTGRIHGLLGVHRLYTADPKAISFIYQNDDLFPKSIAQNIMLKRMLGDGLITVHGLDHRRQRRLLSPAFSQRAVRDMAPLFYEKAFIVRNKFAELIDSTTPNPALPTNALLRADDLKADGARVIDVGMCMEQTTLDVIGTAGFDVDFRTLTGERSELLDAFHEAIQCMQKDATMSALQNRFEILNLIPTKMAKLGAVSKVTMNRIGDVIVDEKTRGVKYSGIEKDTDLGTSDLLSRLIRANMAPDLTDKQRMSHEEVMAQICTFIFAGSETTGVALSWALNRLGQNQAIQDRLRAEMMSISEDNPDVRDLEALPYLQNFTKEILRLDSPVATIARQAAKECILPLGEPIVGRDGKMIDKLHLKKGSEVVLLLNNINRDPEIWGDDANEFNPDRFDDTTIPRKHVPGIFGNLMTFSGGPRNCIGYRFALAEFQTILFVLLRAFSFHELPSQPTIKTEFQLGVMRSHVAGAPEVVVPLLVKTLPSSD